MKKILNKLLSRMVITCFLVVLQLAVMIFGIIILQERYIYISGILKLLSVIVVFHLITKDTNPMIKMAWMVPILLFPVLGGLMYVLYGHVLIPKRLKKNMLRVMQQEVYENVKGANVCQAADIKGEPTYRICNYMEHVAQAPLYKHTNVKYYAIGDDVMDDLIRDLESAEKYIFMEYFIVDKGYMWDTILEILKRKAAATIFNNRDHRKITVIDGKIAHTGGYNMADEYINRITKYGRWKDSGVRLEGEGAWSFTVMFLQMWNYFRYSEGSYLSYKPEVDFSNIEDGYVQPYKSSPLTGENVGENLYIQMINDAQEYIYIFTPYLIVCNELMTALKLAAKRDVDVRIVTPAIPDKKYIYKMTQSNYKELLLAGVRIYQYTPGFIHSKTLIMDGRLASVGSINMDNRSFYHHFECGALLYDCKAIADVKNDMFATFEESEEIDILWCRNNISKVSLIGPLLNLLSPLL